MLGPHPGLVRAQDTQAHLGAHTRQGGHVEGEAAAGEQARDRGVWPAAAYQTTRQGVF